ncbi:PaaI family thioesterase [Rhodococcus sp. NPDC058521]|uniref:PaaI family thioesterase n=1 Tax=Rhodococcus sp. NPDC058521 TaxID=3346536 RepID=UPI0036624A7C
MVDGQSTPSAGNGQSDNAELGLAALVGRPTIGFDGVIGLVYTEITTDRVRAEWTVAPSLHQPAGIQHGGVYCSVVESVASIAGTAWIGRRGHVVGVNNNTDFIRATREGTLTAEGLPIHRGRTQQLWEVRITDERQRLVAKGQVRLANIADTAAIGN